MNLQNHFSRKSGANVSHILINSSFIDDGSKGSLHRIYACNRIDKSAFSVPFQKTLTRMTDDVNWAQDIIWLRFNTHDAHNFTRLLWSVTPAQLCATAASSNKKMENLWKEFSDGAKLKETRAIHDDSAYPNHLSWNIPNVSKQIQAEKLVFKERYHCPRHWSQRNTKK